MCKAHRLMHHSTPGWRVIEEEDGFRTSAGGGAPRRDAVIGALTAAPPAAPRPASCASV